MKRKIYLNEYNIPTNNSIYLPYSSGLLQAYAQQDPQILKHYEFANILFQRDTVENIVEQHVDPDVVGFSVSMWNYQLSLAVAGELKKKYPDCFIIFGGPHITKDTSLFSADVCVYREGERVFKEILLSRLGLLNIKNTIQYDPEPLKDLDFFPSPYTNGVYDNIIAEYPDLEFKAIIETNRNCPFNCAFCYWGSNDITRKIRYHGLDYIQQDFEWIAKNKIEYVFCADANFGMYKRDIDIAKMCSSIKEQYGYPEKFRVCYGKNATKNIFETAKHLSHSDLAKTVTLSAQSFYQPALDAINRKNIKASQFSELQRQYNREGIPTYTELILGLPEETCQSFMEGLEQAIRLTKDNQIFIYHCQVLPNTKLYNRSYQREHGIETVDIPLAEVHVTARDDNFVQEYDRIIIETATMSMDEWVKCTVLSWLVQLFHSLKAGNQIIDWVVKKYNFDYMDVYENIATMSEVDELYNIAWEIIQGHPRCKIDERFGNIYYEMEELTYLNVVVEKDSFYKHLYRIIEDLVMEVDEGHWYDTEQELQQVFKSQIDSLPNPDEFDSLEDFATQVILYGRKNNKIAPQTV